MTISADATWRANIKRVKNNKDGTVVSLVYYFIIIIIIIIIIISLHFTH